MLARLLWSLAYALASLVEALAVWCKEAALVRVKGGEKKEPAK